MKEMGVELPENHEEGIEMVALSLRGIGSATQSPDVMVALLSPIDSDKYKLPNGNEMIYPVAIPSELSPIFFSKINSLYSSNVDLPNLTYYFELISDTKLTALHIYEGRYSIKSELYYVGENGTRGSFKTSMPNGLMTALEQRLDILIDYKLLSKAASYFDVKQKDSLLPSDVSPLQSYYNELKSQISNGVKPDDPLVLHLIKMLASMSDELIQNLLEVAVDSENYEWISVLKNS
ncbi:hypothetical protein [uncultured Porphyromonas sp.]|nr:hypothetical protein [uncultured Porphyromonas sp.]BDE81656.1 hypothetical protein CE91St14_06840 [Porphyromonas somerae]